ncbi:MAG: DUF3597 domain-containing protein [Sphingomonadales bacterium]|nr:DUF3597 domain-containing protein [Sphingomonadales bacterium]
MGFFSKIKDAIFGSKAEAATPAADPAAAPVAEAAPVAAPVDVAASLAAMPGADGLNWRGSIVDLMKLVGIDSSYENRKELAIELGDSNYSGSAEDNIALHKAVMKALADNGGSVPAELLD